MRVTKAQAQANRAHIVETASVLFRERGFDGVGVADLMAAAGFTHGGFYKHFGSKADLMAEASADGLARSLINTGELDVAGFFAMYLSREHRDARSNGCTMAALCGDAARQSDDLKATFASGAEGLLASLQERLANEQDTSAKGGRAALISLFAQAVGAIMLSRACPDDAPLADEILEVCRAQVMASLAQPAPMEN